MKATDGFYVYVYLDPHQCYPEKDVFYVEDGWRKK